MSTPTSQTLASAVRSALFEAMERDEDIVLLGETVGAMGGVAGTTAGLREHFGPDRVIDTPVAERGTLGLAFGLALGGKRPVIELSTSGRLVAALEVLTEVARVAWSGDFTVPMVIRVPYGVEAGPADLPVGQTIAGIPGLTVLCATDAAMAASLLRTALRAESPVVLLEPRVAYDERANVDDSEAQFSARVVREGHHVTLAAWGAGVDAANAAAEALAIEGLSAEVVDLVLLYPVDADTLGSSVRKTGRLVVVHPDDVLVAAAVQRIGLDESFLYLESPLAHAPQAADIVAQVARESIHY